MNHTNRALGIPFRFRSNAKCFSPVIADKILNHVTGQVRGVAAIYQHGEYLEERRVALQKWSDFIEDLVANEDET